MFRVSKFVPLVLLAVLNTPATAIGGLRGDQEPSLDRGLGCNETSFEIKDHGYIDIYRGWYDPSGCGICNQYCRWVGNSAGGGDPAERLSAGSSWWSCQTGVGNRDEIWPRYDGISDSFTAFKCSEKNGEAPQSGPPTGGPSLPPTSAPTGYPTSSPSAGPTPTPTSAPTSSPSARPTSGLSSAPTPSPSA